MICEKCGKKVEKYILSFAGPDKIEPNSIPFINLDEDVPMPGKVLCDECNESKPLKTEVVFKEKGIFGAIEGVKIIFHGAEQIKKMGLSVEERVKYFSNDSSVIVVDPIKNRYYQYGKRIRNKKKIKEILKGR